MKRASLPQLWQHGEFQPWRNQLPRYAALSYEWGNNATDRKVCVNGVELSVTTNLSLALQSLQELGLKTAIWIDSLCIDQSNTEEKSEQVEMMANIYQSAEEVYSWLGPASYDTDLAIAYMRRRHLQPTSRILLQAGRPRVDIALLKLVRMIYWQRTWILQEVALSKSTKILCGGQVADLKQLQYAIYGCLNRHDINKLPFSGILDELSLIYLRESNLFGTVDLSKMTNLFDHRLLEIMRRHVQLHASDPRDKIFGFRSLAIDGEQCISVDYTKPYQQICQEFAINIIRLYHELDIIRSAGIGLSSRSDPNFPSWVPDWRSCAWEEAAHPLPRVVFWEHLPWWCHSPSVHTVGMGDFLANVSSLDDRPWATSITFSSKRVAPIAENGGVLSLDGHVFDIVTFCHTECGPPNSKIKWINLLFDCGGLMYPTGITKLQALFRMETLDQVVSPRYLSAVHQFLYCLGAELTEPQESSADFNFQYPEINSFSDYLLELQQGTFGLAHISAFQQWALSCLSQLQNGILRNSLVNMDVFSTFPIVKTEILKLSSAIPENAGIHEPRAKNCPLCQRGELLHQSALTYSADEWHSALSAACQPNSIPTFVWLFWGNSLKPSRPSNRFLPFRPKGPANKTYLRQRKLATEHKKYFKTSEGYFGLGPKGMQKGDLVCLLPGLRVPMLLRRIENQRASSPITPSPTNTSKTSGLNHYFVIVGECFVFGLMPSFGMRYPLEYESWQQDWIRRKGRLQRFVIC